MGSFYYDDEGKVLNQEEELGLRSVHSFCAGRPIVARWRFSAYGPMLASGWSTCGKSMEVIVRIMPFLPIAAELARDRA